MPVTGPPEELRVYRALERVGCRVEVMTREDAAQWMIGRNLTVRWMPLIVIDPPQ
jgi:hypothetical protein